MQKIGVNRLKKIILLIIASFLLVGNVYAEPLNVTNLGGGSCGFLCKDSDPFKFQFNFFPNGVIYNLNNVPNDFAVVNITLFSETFYLTNYTLQYYVNTLNPTMDLYYGIQNFNFFPIAYFGKLHFTLDTPYFSSPLNSKITLPITKSYLNNTYYIQALVTNGNEIYLSNAYKADLSAIIIPGLDPSNILYLNLDEGSGDIAYDLSGYGNNGTLFNNPT